MAEAFGIVTGCLTLLEVTTKVIKQCKAIMETAHDAPRDLRHILIETSSLKAVLESFEYLSQPEFSDTAHSLVDANGIVEGCQKTVEELSKELEGLSFADTSRANATSGKRQRLKGSLQWCLKESKTRKLLEEAMQHKTTLTLALLGEITSDVKQIKSTVEQVRERLTKTDRKKMCDWIEQTNPTSIHHRSCKNHEEQTCKWIHCVDQWKDWLHLQRKFIWIHGIPGAGKTVFASYLIEQIITYCATLRNTRAICLYYYCSFLHGKAEQRDEAQPFLRWVVSQLCRDSDHIPIHLITLYEKNGLSSSKALEEALQQLLMQLDVLYIVIDAVDESSPRDNLLELIQHMVTKPEYGKIQLLVTSRRYADIEEVLRPLSQPTLPMSNSIVDADIRTYIDTTIHGNKTFARWSETLRRDISEALAQGSQGMFRWVVCQIDRLQRKSPQQAREAIKHLPRTLEETYETILLEIPEEDWSTARTALQLISGHSDLGFSYEIPSNCLSAAVLSSDRTSTLDVSEDGHEHGFLKVILGCLMEVSSIDDDDVDYEDWPFGDRKSVHGDADDTCFHTVSLAHYTIQEFIFSDRIKSSRASYFSMSRSDCAYKMLKVVLHAKTQADYYFLHSDGYNAFKNYCIFIGRACLRVWESVFLEHDSLRHQHLDFFLQHKDSWHLYEEGGDVKDIVDVYFLATDDPFIAEVQYLTLILDAECFRMADHLLEKHCLEAILCVSLPVALQCVQKNATHVPGFTTILDILGGIRGIFSSIPYKTLVDQLMLRMELPKLLLFLLRAHYHEWACNDDCVIVDLMEAGANANSYYYLLTPLQIAVRNWDYAGVEILLDYGADPNAVGQRGGYIPAHMEATWSQSSPLHILRNAEYNFMAMESFSGDKAIRAEQRPRIESLLLESGARDFT